MGRIAAAWIAAAALAAGPACAGPSASQCQIKAVPAQVCLQPRAAAFMWELTHHDRAAASAPGYEALLKKNQCVAIQRREYEGYAVRPIANRIMVHTAMGRSQVQRITIADADALELYISAAYLTGPCIPSWDTDAIEAFKRGP
jgi:hypothetical protein